MAEVCVGRRDADGLAGFQGQTRRGGAEDGREDTTGDSTGIHLLELQQGLILLWGVSSHRNFTLSQFPPIVFSDVTQGLGFNTEKLAQGDRKQQVWLHRRYVQVLHKFTW